MPVHCLCPAVHRRSPQGAVAQGSDLRVADLVRDRTSYIQVLNITPECPLSAHSTTLLAGSSLLAQQFVLLLLLLIIGNLGQIALQFTVGY